MNAIVILSGGRGLRFDNQKPKQYHLLRGKEIISYVFEATCQSTVKNKIIIVSNQQLPYAADYAQGGITHNESVKNAIDYIIEHYHNCENVVFADSARPFITPKSIDELFDLLNEYDAITTAQEITDSLGKGGNQFVERSDYFLIQKPAAFRFDVLRKHFRADSVCTAIIQQIPENYRKTCYFGLKQNMKITYPEDLVIAEAIMNNRE